MRQRLAIVMTCVGMTVVSAVGGAEEKPSANIGRSVLEFFASHDDLTIDDFLARLRPEPIGEDDRAKVLGALPSHGAIRAGVGDVAKMTLAEDVLAYHRRHGVITFKIIDVTPAYVGLYERAVILVSPSALAMANKEELAALVAHEIGHEYVWADYERAKSGREYRRLRELELRCDGIAVLTLRRLGLNPERLVRAVEMMTWYNEQRHLAADRKEYASRDDRRAFIRAIAMLPWREMP
jgi:hypothetical protein